MAAPRFPPAAPPVVVLIPAKDSEGSIGGTVLAASAIPGVDRVIVIDDGSRDSTAEAALETGADVLRLNRNHGKGGAVAKGVAASPEAGVYLLLDADLGATASCGEALLGPVLSGEADLTIGVLPSAGTRGGFGLVRDLAGWIVERSSGFSPEAPLSGQRAVRAEFLRGLRSAERFGLEVAMTIDTARAGGRVLEVAVEMDHRHTGRSLAGFKHRAGQGLDMLRAAWPRLTTRGARRALVVAVALAVLAFSSAIGAGVEPRSVPLASPADRVVIFAVPHLGIEDLGSGAVPGLDRLATEGALAAMTVRTLSSRPSATEAFGTISAGTRVYTSQAAAQAFDPETVVEGGTARDVAARRSGAVSDGEVIVVGGSHAIRSAGEHVSSRPGLLGDALDAAGLTTGVVTNGDTREDEDFTTRRPAALALMDSSLGVDVGEVEGSALLVEDPSAPFGIRISRPAFVREALRVVEESEVAVLDPGETQRAYGYRLQATEDQEERLRSDALRRTDEILMEVVAELPEGTLLLVAGVTPPTRDWELTPVVAWGAGVTPGHLHSSSTRRADLVALTDLAPTVLDALDVASPTGMIGEPLRYRTGEVDLGSLHAMNDVAVGREGIYFPMAVTFIVLQALVYLFAVLVLSTRQGLSGLTPYLRFTVITFAAWPLATFLLRSIPGAMEIGSGAQVVTWLIAGLVTAGASRACRKPLAALGAVAGLTVSVLVADLAIGAPLQMSSVLGYSPHTAARFTGIGNTAYAVLGAAAIVWAAVHVDLAQRKGEALLTAAATLAVVLIVDGAPWLGADVGGIISLLPVFGLTIWVMSGRKVRARTLVLAVGATVIGLGLALGFDLMRPDESQTHLARFFNESVDDPSSFWTTISRKWATNLRVFQRSIWTWMVPVMAALLVYVLVVARGWQRFLPEGSPRRAGVLGTLAAGVLGWLVNDSGVVVAALVFVYLAPLLTLLALEAEEGDELLLAPG